MSELMSAKSAQVEGANRIGCVMTVPRLCLPKLCAIRYVALFTIQTFYAKFPTAAPVKLVEWVTHTTRLRTPQLGIQRLQSLQIGVERSSLVCESNKRRILRLERGGDRYWWSVMLTIEADWEYLVVYIAPDAQPK